MIKASAYPAHIFGGSGIQTEHSRADFILLLYKVWGLIRMPQWLGVGTGILWRFVHSHVWPAIDTGSGALGWDPGWGSFLKHLCMASFSNLGFLSAWQPGSKVVSLETAKWASRSCTLFKPQPQESHRMTSTKLFLEQSLRSLPRLMGRENRLSPLLGSSKVFVKYMGPEDLLGPSLVHIFGT